MFVKNVSPRNIIYLEAEDEEVEVTIPAGVKKLKINEQIKHLSRIQARGDDFRF